MLKEETTPNYLDEISNFIFASKYARYDEKKGRREIWEEAVNRVEQMHLKKYDFLDKEDKEEIKLAFDLVRQKMVLPSMRSLQYGGKAIESKNSRIFNCAVRHVDSIRSFAEIHYLLLNGCGVGIGVSKKYINRLPDLVNEKDRTGTVITYTIDDTIEGWADSVEALLNCYLHNTPYTGRKIVFDYSKIRQKGMQLKTSGGKAPGYKGLKNAHIKIKSLLDYIIEEKKQRRLKSVDIYDILMHCADSVLSGGCRRSATCIIFDKTDQDLLTAKTNLKVDHLYHFSFSHEKVIGENSVKYYEGRVKYKNQKIDIILSEYELALAKKDGWIFWKHLEPQRARSNNSVLLLRNKIDFEEFKRIYENTKQYGEPGFCFVDDENTLLNPCFEISFIPVKDGVCGVQFCNLSTMNGRLIDTKEKFFDCAKAATIIGTLQASYTNFPYLSKVSEDLTSEESLLGVSITGMMENKDILLNPVLQKQAAEICNKTNKIWAKKLLINPAARITCIKPEGTSSLLLSTSSGIHPHHSRKYIRRVQCNKIDNIYKFFKTKNPHLCEESVWSENKTDDVVSFPVIVNDKAIVKKDISAIDHLEIIKNTQQNWVKPGTTEYNKKTLHHNVSCTVSVKDEEWDRVCKYLYDNREDFCAVSLLSVMGDKVYAQSPNESINTPAEEENFNNIIKNFNHVDYKHLKEEDDETTLQQEIACAGGKCEV